MSTITNLARQGIARVGGFVALNAAMLSLGGFKFMVSTAAYQELQHSSEYRWGSQDVFGRKPVRQFLGVGDESITLNGVIFPEFKGGYDQMTTLRGQAAQGKPFLMTAGTGDILGLWVVEEIEEVNSVFAMRGKPRKIEFMIRLRKFKDVADLQNKGW